MSGVLMDNWILQDALFDTELNDAFYNLLEAIVLWDDVYYPDNEYSQYWKYISKDSSLQEAITSCEDNSESYQEKAESIFRLLNGNDDNSITQIGAIRYMILSSKNKLNYLPCKKRSEYISQLNFSNKFHEKINRLDLNGIFDKQVLEYYNDLNDFLGKNILEFNMPLLADFIIQNTPNNSSYIKYALQLKKNKKIDYYRKYLQNIEDSFNNGNWRELLRFKMTTQELVNDIVKEMELSVSTSVSICAMPSLNFSLDIPVKNKRFIQLSFLRELGGFAFNGRKMAYVYPDNEIGFK